MIIINTMIYSDLYNGTTSILTISSNTIDKECINVIKKIALDKWGWHFIPHKNMQWEKDDWFKDQTLVISFSDKDDLINCRFSIDLN